MSIGEKIFELRKKKGLSQEAVADMLGVSRQTVSKWETNASAPDFDKIVPLCDLFDISTDELLKGIKSDENITFKTSDVSKQKALVVSVSVLLYFISIIFIIVGSEVFNLNDGILCGGFLGLAAIPTVLLIFYFMTLPKEVKVKREESKNKKIVDAINSVLALIILIVYLSVSFMFNAWPYSWILWIVYAIVTEIVELIFVVKENNNEE